MDAVTSSMRLAHVRDQVSRLPNAKHHTDYTFISCPFHSERTPSGRVFHSESTRSPGFFKCYGCGKTATWDELAPMIGCEPFTRGKPKDEYTLPLLSRLNEKLEGEHSVEEQLEFWRVPPNKVWRTIPTNLLIDIGARMCRVIYPGGGTSDKFVFLPVNVNGEQRGYIKARLRKVEDKPSYINSKGGWSKRYGLFPYDYTKAMLKRSRAKTLFLVEGQRDCLRLLNHGMPAVSILGTQSWTQGKARLIEMLEPDLVVPLMDGDCAGVRATDLMMPDLIRFVGNVKPVKLWNIKGSPYRKFAHLEEPSKAAKAAGVSLWDPGNLPEDLLLKIKRKYMR